MNNNQKKLTATAVRNHQARRLVLDLRKRALAFVEWLERAVVTFESALYPTIEIGPDNGKGVRPIKVTFAGFPALGSSSTIQTALARDLLRIRDGNGEPVKLDNSDPQAGKWKKKIPSLRGLLIRHGDTRVSLDSEMIARITEIKF